MIEDTFIYKSTDMALYMIACANKQRISLNITKIQKLLYIIYGTFLRVYSKRLINEHPQAWPYGPVFPTTRNSLLGKDFVNIDESYIDKKVVKQMKEDEELQKVIDFVLEVFGGWNAGQLSEWSHSDNSPWSRTKEKFLFKWGDVIPDQYIQEYFEKIIKVEQEE